MAMLFTYRILDNVQQLYNVGSTGQDGEDFDFAFNFDRPHRLEHLYGDGLAGLDVEGFEDDRVFAVADFAEDLVVL